VTDRPEPAFITVGGRLALLTSTGFRCCDLALQSGLSVTRLRARASGLSVAPFSHVRVVKSLLFKSRIRLALQVGVLLAAAFTFWPRTPKPNFYFDVTMRSAQAGFAQLFYDTGSGVNEASSVRLPVEGGNREVVYKFPLPEGTYSGLRFYPTNRANNLVVLSQAQIVTGAGRLIRAIDPGQIKAWRQTERIESASSSASLTITSTADDPILALELGETLVLKNFARESCRTFARRFLVSFLPALVLGLLAAPFLQLLRVKSAGFGWSARAWSGAEAHPQRAVLAVATLAVLLSCYPVVFFGRSFVSPNNHSHTYLLYGEMPTVPGYKDVATDDEKGSDLGAMMWYSWPTSVVESRALYNFELPLWNRYDSTGLTLLGQGQSMFGDPLHFLVLLAKGASWSWDLKYLLAKLLFASCLGLCVLQSARHLPGALFITASASFIGFFSYRYSHPAFFSLCYAPTILLCWLKLIDARPGRATAAWLMAMVLADWAVLNSGTVKEAYILLLTLNSCGLLTLLLGRSVVGGKGIKLLQAVAASLLFLAIATPIWLTFFHALQNSLTAYDSGGVWQITPGLLIGFFDDIFYRQFNLNESHLDPTLNFFILLSFLWFLCSSQRADPRGLSRGLILTSLGAMAFVFGVVPAGWITRMPLLKSILHIDNTFSCVAIVCVLLLAGFGVKAFWTDCRTANFQRTYLRVMAVFGGMVALYLGTTQAAMRSTIPMLRISEHIPKSSFFWGYSFSLFLAAALAPWLGRYALRVSRGAFSPIFSLSLLFVLFHWRHGMHLATPFDAYVMNPQRRVDLVADSSPAVQLLKSHTTEPSRALGLDSALFPGYGGAIGIEQIDGPDPILNKDYQALLDASEAKLIFGGLHTRTLGQDLAAEPLLYNMLNVRYYLGDAGLQASLAPSLKKIASLDLDVYESEHVWPRAFFTNGVVAYEQEADFIELLKKSDGAPFAAIPTKELAKQKELTNLATPQSPSPGRQVMPARTYQFTSNTTSFKVTASGPGVVVLTEAFVPGDFDVRLNGKPATYFRVNSAFRGVFLPEAGEYFVSFAYWPHYFNLSLLIAGGGAAILFGWLGFLSRGAPERRTAP
jgi:hypothetical protein